MAENKNIFLIIAVLVILAILVFGLSGKTHNSGISDNPDAKSVITIEPPQPGTHQSTQSKPTSGATGAAIKILPIGR